MARTVPPRHRRGSARDALARSIALRDIPWNANLALTRGKCRKCGSRYAVTRLTFTLTDPKRVERYATLECAHCAHTWRRVQPTLAPGLHGEQRARLTIVEPGSGRTIVRTVRGRIIAQGEDIVTTRDVTLAELDDAVRAWRKRSGDNLTRRAVAQQKRAAEDAAAIARGAILRAKWDARDAERAAEEAAAQAREAA
jgi:hypothetical protein